MKTTVRITTLVFALGLAGVLATAWGAESVSELITQGEAAITKTNANKDALDAAMKKNSDLAAEGTQIRAEGQQLQTDIAALKKQTDAVNQQTADYKAKCDGKQLNPDAFKACTAQLAEINANIKAVNAQPAMLTKRQNDYMAQATKFNRDVKTAPDAVRAAENVYRKALENQYDWLDKARVMVASPAFQPYAKKAGCPDVSKPAKTDEAAMAMSDETLACLKKVANSN